jgi:replicative DNA helicase
MSRDCQPEAVLLELTAQAERAAVAGMLLSGEAVDDAAAVLTVDDLTVNSHRVVFSAAVAVRDAGDAFSLEAVFRHIVNAKQLVELAPTPNEAVVWLHELATEAGSGCDLEPSVRQVKDYSLRRSLRQTFVRAVADSAQPGRPVAELMADVEGELYRLGQASAGVSGGPVNFKTTANELIAAIDDRLTGRATPPGVATGLTALDNVLGGLRPGQLVIVAGRPGQGKSALANAFALNAVAAGVGTLVMSLEMSREEITARLTAMQTGVPLNRLLMSSTLTDDELTALKQFKVKHLGLWIDDRPGLTLAAIASTIRRAVSRYKIGLAIVDYAQLVRPNPDHAREPMHIRVGHVSATLKGLSKSLGIPIVLLAQVSRNAENRDGKRPQLADLKDSGNLEQDADVVLLLHPQESVPGEPRQTYSLIVAKQRNGPAGVDVPLVYTAPLTRFENAPLRW